MRTTLAAYFRHFFDFSIQGPSSLVFLLLWYNLLDVFFVMLGGHSRGSESVLLCYANPQYQVWRTHNNYSAPINSEYRYCTLLGCSCYTWYACRAVYYYCSTSSTGDVGAICNAPLTLGTSTCLHRSRVPVLVRATGCGRWNSSF
jgi:hypothetical protein